MKTNFKFIGPIVILIALCLTGLDKVYNNQLGAWFSGCKPILKFIPFGITVLLFSLVPLAFKWLQHYFSKKFFLKLITFVLFISLVVGQLLCLLFALPHITGLPHGIDHPCFMFRIHEFFEVFPLVGAYNPWWNAGTEHFIGVTSGAHAFAFLVVPFLLFGTFEQVYGPALFFWLFVGGPWLAVISLRSMGLRWCGAFSAGLLMLAFTRAEYLFFWQSGNVGGMVTCLFTVPMVALTYKICILRKGTILSSILLGLCGWISCIWPAGIMTPLGLGFGVLLNIRRLDRKAINHLIIAVLIALILISQWLWALLFPSKGIVDYVAEVTNTDYSITKMFVAGCRQFFRRISEWHPLLVTIGFGGLLFTKNVRWKYFLFPVFCVLSCVAISIGFYRDSQLDRIAIQMGAVAIVPTSVFIGRFFGVLLKKTNVGYFHIYGRTIILLLLLFSVYVAQSHARNSAGFKLWAAEPVVFEYVDWVKKNVPKSGRLAFAGLTDCFYDWGKIAYLPILADREMMSDDYYGFPKGLTGRRYPPKAYLKSLETHASFSELYGITHWSVSDDRQRSFFFSSTNVYEHVAQFQMQSSSIDIFAFKQQQNPTRCLIGNADVDAKESLLQVSISEVDNGLVVLRYNWRPGLVCLTPGVQIEPYNADENLKFIAIRPNNENKVLISYKLGWRKLEPNFDGQFHH